MGALAKVIYGVVLSKKSVEKLKKITEDEEIWDNSWPEGTIEYAMTAYNSKEKITLECASYNEYSVL
jgi:protoporphyrinogen oxidase